MRKKKKVKRQKKQKMASEVGYSFRARPADKRFAARPGFKRSGKWKQISDPFN